MEEARIETWFKEGWEEIQPQKEVTCFISYAWEEEREANERLQGRLRELQRLLSQGKVACTLDLSHLEMGHHIKSFMREGISLSHYVLLAATPSLKTRSALPSSNIAFELALAEEKRSFFPLALWPLVSLTLQSFQPSLNAKLIIQMRCLGKKNPIRSLAF